MQEVVTTIGYTVTERASVSYFYFEFGSLYVLDLSIKMLIKNFPNYINKSWKDGLGRSLHCFSSLVETCKLNVLFAIGTVFFFLEKGVDSEWCDISYTQRMLFHFVV